MVTDIVRDTNSRDVDPARASPKRRCTATNVFDAGDHNLCHAYRRARRRRMAPVRDVADYRRHRGETRVADVA